MGGAHLVVSVTDRGVPIIRFGDRSVDPEFLNGKSFLFAHLDHWMCGTILSTGGGPGEFVMYVSTPRFEGITIRRLERKGSDWYVVGTDDAGKPASAIGVLVLTE